MYSTLTKALNNLFFVGTSPPQEPYEGQAYYDKVRNCFRVYVGRGWQEVADAPSAQTSWRCLYCNTMFDEQRCPTCGAGRINSSVGEKNEVALLHTLR